MLYEFKSKVTGTVVMTAPVAERLLALVGKDATAQGIFTVEQLGPAIAALEAAIENDRQDRAQAERTWQAEHGGDPDAERERERLAATTVTLAQRAWPLLDALRTALNKAQPVTWGV
jgi:hypothetical protein